MNKRAFQNQHDLECVWRYSNEVITVLSHMLGVARPFLMEEKRDYVICKVWFILYL